MIIFNNSCAAVKNSFIAVSNWVVCLEYDSETIADCSVCAKGFLWLQIPCNPRNEATEKRLLNTLYFYTDFALNVQQ